MLRRNTCSIICGLLLTAGICGWLLPAALAGAKPELEAEVLSGVNRVRQEQGLPALRRDAELDRLARQYCLILIRDKDFSHNAPSGGSLEQRLERGGVTGWRIAGENLARSLNATEPAAEAVRGWQLSPGHRRNMLGAEYNLCGTGVVHDPDSGYVYVVQIYLGRG